MRIKLTFAEAALKFSKLLHRADVKSEVQLLNFAAQKKKKKKKHRTISNVLENVFFGQKDRLDGGSK